jgi:hypothetical protein
MKLKSKRERETEKAYYQLSQRVFDCDVEIPKLKVEREIKFINTNETLNELNENKNEERATYIVVLLSLLFLILAIYRNKNDLSEHDYQNCLLILLVMTMGWIIVKHNMVEICRYEVSNFKIFINSLTFFLTSILNPSFVKFEYFELLIGSLIILSDFEFAFDVISDILKSNDERKKRKKRGKRKN